MRHLTRNPFDRYTVVKRNVAETKCNWCGQPAKFQYGYDDDSHGLHFVEGTFCSKEDCEAYHNIELK